MVMASLLTSRVIVHTTGSSLLHVCFNAWALLFIKKRSRGIYTRCADMAPRQQEAIGSLVLTEIGNYVQIFL